MVFFAGVRFSLSFLLFFSKKQRPRHAARSFFATMATAGGTDKMNVHSQLEHLQVRVGLAGGRRAHCGRRRAASARCPRLSPGAADPTARCITPCR